MKIVIIGGTGLIGSALIHDLITNSEIKKIISVTRKEQKINSPKFENIILPHMSEKDILRLELDAEFYVCTLGITMSSAGSKEAFRFVDYDLVLAFAQLAKKRQANSLFLVSALGANKNSSFFYNQVKGEMEFSVAQLELPSVYFLQPSLLIGNRIEKRWLENVGVKTYQFIDRYFPRVLSRKFGTKVEDIVSFIGNELKNPQLGVHRVTNFILKNK